VLKATVDWCSEARPFAPPTGPQPEALITIISDAISTRISGMGSAALPEWKWSIILEVVTLTSSINWAHVVVAVRQGSRPL
jgi:hypothetical protein